nr:hypothetical protein [Streptomyces sp. FXJ7.023]
MLLVPRPAQPPAVQRADRLRVPGRVQVGQQGGDPLVRVTAQDAQGMRGAADRAGLGPQEGGQVLAQDLGAERTHDFRVLGPGPQTAGVGLVQQGPEQQRIAGGPRPHRRHELRVRAAQGGLDRPAHALGAEGAQPDPPVRRAHQRAQGGARGGHDTGRQRQGEHDAAAVPSGQALRELRQRLRVAPLQIVDQDEHRTVAGHTGQDRRQGHPVADRSAVRVVAGPPRLAGPRRRRDAGRGLHQLVDHTERQPPLRAGRLRPEDRDPLAGRLLGQGLEERRSARAERALDQQQGSVSRRGPAQAGSRQRQFGLTFQ